MPRFKRISFGDFGDGVNTKALATELNDTELANILNMEYDRQDNLTGRPGTVNRYTTPADLGRVTSIFGFRTFEGSPRIIVTAGDEIYTQSADDAAELVSIKGELDLPTDTYWQWVTMNGYAIGVNGGEGVDNIIVWDGNTSEAEALDSTAFQNKVPKYITVWGNRIWIACTDTPTRVYFSAVGSHTDFSGASGFYSGGGEIEIGFYDGDAITGIRPNRGRFVIFKRNSIWQIATGISNPLAGNDVATIAGIDTDPSRWAVRSITHNLGCLSGYTIQPVISDLVFLSDSGVYSLQAIEALGDTEPVPISDKIKELADVNKTIDTFASVIVPDKNQYWLSVPNNEIGEENDIVYVLDFSNQQRLRWSKFNGLVAGASYGIIEDSNFKKVLLIGGPESLGQVYTYAPRSTYLDDGDAYTISLTTKAFVFGDQNSTYLMLDKLFHQIGIGLRIIKDDVSVTIAYTLNEDSTKSSSRTLDFTNIVPAGAIWGTSLFGTGVYSSEAYKEEESWIRLSDPTPGRRGQSIQITISKSTGNSNFTLKELSLDASPINLRHTRDNT